MQLSTAACDVASPGELAALTDQLQAAGAPPISGIVHAGGIIQVQTIVSFNVCLDLEIDPVDGKMKLLSGGAKVASVYVLCPASHI